MEYDKSQRLHVTIPKHLFTRLMQYGKLRDIDNLVTKLLTDYIDREE